MSIDWSGWNPVADGMFYKLCERLVAGEDCSGQSEMLKRLCAQIFNCVQAMDLVIAAVAELESASVEVQGEPAVRAVKTLLKDAIHAIDFNVGMRSWLIPGIGESLVELMERLDAYVETLGYSEFELKSGKEPSSISIGNLISLHRSMLDADRIEVRAFKIRENESDSGFLVVEPVKDSLQIRFQSDGETGKSDSQKHQCVGISNDPTLEPPKPLSKVEFYEKVRDGAMHVVPDNSNCEAREPIAVESLFEWKSMNGGYKCHPHLGKDDFLVALDKEAKSHALDVIAADCTGKGDNVAVIEEPSKHQCLLTFQSGRSVILNTINEDWCQTVNGHYFCDKENANRIEVNKYPYASGCYPPFYNPETRTVHGLTGYFQREYVDEYVMTKGVSIDSIDRGSFLLVPCDKFNQRFMVKKEVFNSKQSYDGLGWDIIETNERSITISNGLHDVRIIPSIALSFEYLGGSSDTVLIRVPDGFVKYNFDHDLLSGEWMTIKENRPVILYDEKIWSLCWVVVDSERKWNLTLTDPKELCDDDVESWHLWSDMWCRSAK